MTITRGNVVSNESGDSACSGLASAAVHGLDNHRGKRSRGSLGVGTGFAARALTRAVMHTTDDVTARARVWAGTIWFPPTPHRVTRSLVAVEEVLCLLARVLGEVLRGLADLLGLGAQLVS